MIQQDVTAVIPQAQKLMEEVQKMTALNGEMTDLLSAILSQCQEVVEVAQSVNQQLAQADTIPQIKLSKRQATLNKRLRKIKRWRWLSKLPVFGYFFVSVGKQKRKEVTKQVLQLQQEELLIKGRESAINHHIATLDLLIFELSERVMVLKRKRLDTQRDYQRQLEASWFELYQKWHGFERPIYLNQTTYHSLIHSFLKEEKRLRKEGWQGLAINTYLTLLDKAGQPLDNRQSLLSLQKDFRRDSRLVGSALYEAMYQALNHVTERQLREKAQLPIRHLGGYIDDNGMLQLKGLYKFSPTLSPDSCFLETYAETVKQAYPQGLLPAVYGMTDPMSDAYQTIKAIHQFRMYLDRQNIFYIRRNYQGATDYDKLLAFEKEAVKRVGKAGRLDYSSNSMFHNRTSLGLPFYGQHNDKIKSNNGLSEFIVRVKEGSFATQWDVLRTSEGHSFFIKEGGRVIGLRYQVVNSDPQAYDLKGLKGKEVVDTESFNYSARDYRKSGDISHSLLDVDPANARLGLEHAVKILAKKTWKTQTKQAYGNNGRDRYHSAFKPESNQKTLMN